jgi:hypothetical protein
MRTMTSLLVVLGLFATADAAPKKLGYMRDLTGHGGRLYAATDRGLAVFEPRDPARPQLAAFVPIADTPALIAGFDRYVAVASSDGARIFDVTRTRPSLVKTVRIDPEREAAPWIAAEGSTLVVTTWQGIRVLVATANGIEQAAVIDGAFGMVVLARGVLIAAELERAAPGELPGTWIGATVIDLRDPRAPRRLGTLTDEISLLTNGYLLWAGSRAYEVVPGAMPRLLGEYERGRGFLYCATARVTVLGSLPYVDGRRTTGDMRDIDTSGIGCAEHAGWLYIASGYAPLTAKRISELEVQVGDRR